MDLNLVVPLNALLQERSVTAAARRIGLSQPACSAALKRLRRHFGDELLVWSPGRPTQLTLLGERLRDPVALLVSSLDDVLTAHGVLRPDALAREFTVLLSDAECSALAAPLVRGVRAGGTGARLRFDLLTNDQRTGLVEATEHCDVVIAPQEAVHDDLPAIDLFTDEWVRIVAADADAHDAALDPADDDLDGAEWAVCYDLPLMPWSPGRLLEADGRSRDIVVRVETFRELFPLVAGAGLTALVPRRLATAWCERSGTRALPVPPSLDRRFTLSMAWSPRRTHDPAHRWFRQQVLDAARLDVAPPA